MSDELIELPEGWESTNLGELGEWSSGGTPSRKNLEYYGGEIFWIKTGDLTDGLIEEIEETITKEGLDNSSAKIFPSGSLVVAMYGATIGKLGILNQSAATNQACAVLKASKTTASLVPYLFYYLLERREDLRMIGQGGAQPNISQTILKEYPCLLPPIAEQKRIVAKIEELRSRTQKAREALEAIPEMCDRFRQSVLAAAFRGDLTADWREENPDVESASVLLERIRRDRRDHKSLKVVDNSQLPELPEGWIWISLEEIASHRSGIAFKSAEFVGAGIQVIRLGNVYKGQLDLSRDPVFLPEEYAIDNFTLKAGDIIVSQTGTRFKRDYGNFVLIPKDCPRLFLNQRLLAISCHDLINPEYVVLASKLKIYQDHFFSHETGGVNQGNVGVSGVMKGCIPLAPQEESRILLERIKTAFNYIGKAELACKRNEANLNYLDRAILAEAFRGELVPQDPNDEPASVLLDRIQQERAQVSNRSSKRKR